MRLELLQLLASSTLSLSNLPLEVPVAFVIVVGPKKTASQAEPNSANSVVPAYSEAEPML